MLKMQNDYGEGRKLNTVSHLTETSLTRSLFWFFFHLNLLLLVFTAACALRPLVEAERTPSCGARHLLSANFLAAGKAVAETLQSFTVSQMNNRCVITGWIQPTLLLG